MKETSWTEARPGTVELRSRILRDGSDAAVETVRLVCDEATLAPRGLYVAVRDALGWRTLEALPARGAGGGWLAVLVSGPDGVRDRRDLELPADAAVDYPSPALEALMLGRLALAPGQAREVPVLHVEAPSLVASAARRRYVRCGS